MEISTPEIISLALIGATTKAAQLRATNTQPDALSQLEQSIIPELSVLSQTEATAIISEKLKKKKKKKVAK